MKNPNGYGSVIKLSGKRRRPFAARITISYDDNGKQTYKYLGYYETRKEALQELSLYSANPYDTDLKKITDSYSQKRTAYHLTHLKVTAAYVVTCPPC